MRPGGLQKASLLKVWDPSRGLWHTYPRAWTQWLQDGYAHSRQDLILTAPPCGRDSCPGSKCPIDDKCSHYSVPEFDPQSTHHTFRHSEPLSHNTVAG